MCSVTNCVLPLRLATLHRRYEHVALANRQQAVSCRARFSPQCLAPEGSRKWFMKGPDFGPQVLEIFHPLCAQTARRFSHTRFERIQKPIELAATIGRYTRTHWMRLSKS